jgi:hypothetical protein
LVYAQEQYLILRDILEDYFDAKKIAQLNLEKQKTRTKRCISKCKNL